MNTLIKTTITAILITLTLACINTSYSRDDEIEIDDREVDILIGQFPHHGEAFYEREVTRTTAILEGQPEDFEARNDLASAYIKLGKYNKAEAEFLLNEKKYPARYKTAANLGVLFKKAGRYKEAAENIKKSLEIKPAGHMGLGDYYLKMIVWKKNNQEQQTIATDSKKCVPLKNFLGVDYSAGPAATANSPHLNKEYLITLIKNDYQFPDVYVVLGDVYLQKKDYQLALRAYMRAESLGHPSADMVYDRLGMIQAKWHSMKTRNHIIERDFGMSQVESEINSAKLWLSQYQNLEKSRIDKNLAVDFKTMKNALMSSGIEKAKVIEAGFYLGEVHNGRDAINKLIATVLVFGAALLILILFLIRSFIKKNRKRYQEL